MSEKKDKGGKSPEGQSRDIIAKFTGVGERTLKKAEGQKSGGRGKKKDKLAADSAQSIKSREKAATALNTTHDTLSKLDIIVQAAEENLLGIKRNMI